MSRESDRELAERLLEIGLDWELGGARPRLPAPRLAARLEAALDHEKRGGSAMLRLFPGPLLIVANAAGIVLVVLALWHTATRREESGRPPADPPKPATSREDAVEKIESIDDPGAIASLDPKLTALRADGDRFDDAALGRIVARVPSLRRLELRDARVTDGGLRHLGALDHLERLGLRECARITDDGVARLAQLRGLRELDLTGFVGQIGTFQGEGPTEDPFSKIGDGSAGHLASMKSLRRLTLFGTLITDRGLDVLTASGPPLEALDVGATSIGPKGVEHLLRLKSSLRSLSLEGNPRLGDEAMMQLPALDLEELTVGGNGFQSSDITRAGLASISCLEGLRRLSLRWCGGIPSDGFRALASMPKLEALHLWSCPSFDDESLAALSSMSLTRLTLCGRVGVTDAGLAAARLARLQHLEIRGGAAAITSRGLAAFRAGHPGASVVDARRR